MYCTNCGVQLPPGAQACPSCGHPTLNFPPPASVPNYLVQSILTTVCCCPPFGIVALVFSSQVNSKLVVGDVAGAEASARKARTWVIVAFVSGIVVAIAGVAVSLWQG